MGLKILKIDPRAPIFFRKIKRYKKPLYIEFLGASGVGKTYLYKRVIRKQKNWVDKKNYDYNLARGWNVPFYELLAEEKIKLINKSGYSNLDKMFLFTFSEAVLLRDLYIKTTNHDLIVSNDDGILHNYTDVLNNIITNKPSQDLIWFLSNRLAVFCHASPEVLVERIYNRKEKDGQIRPQHKNKTYESVA